MTIKYQYKCNTCSHDYIEQRGNDEPNPFFTTCNSCNTGTYEEVNKEILSLEPERNPGIEAPTPEEITEITPETSDVTPEEPLAE